MDGGGGGGWEVGGGGEVGCGGWEVGGTEPDRTQAHHGWVPQAMLTVPNRTVTPMITPTDA